MLPETLEGASLLESRAAFPAFWRIVVRKWSPEDSDIRRRNVCPRLSLTLTLVLYVSLALASISLAVAANPLILTSYCSRAICRSLHAET